MSTKKAPSISQHFRDARIQFQVKVGYKLEVRGVLSLIRCVSKSVRLHSPGKVFAVPGSQPPGCCPRVFPPGAGGTTLSQISPWRTERAPVRLTNQFGCCSLLHVLLLTSPLPHSVECNKIETLHRKHKVEIKKKQVCTLLKIRKLILG